MMSKAQTEYMVSQALTALDNLIEKYLPSWEGGAAVRAREAIIHLQSIMDKAAIDYDLTIQARDQARAEIDDLRSDLTDARNGWESVAEELRRCDSELRAVPALQDTIISERNKAAAERDALLRGEFVCIKCGLRKNCETDEKPEF